MRENLTFLKTMYVRDAYCEAKHSAKQTVTTREAPHPLRGYVEQCAFGRKKRVIYFSEPRSQNGTSIRRATIVCLERLWSSKRGTCLCRQTIHVPSQKAAVSYRRNLYRREKRVFTCSSTEVFFKQASAPLSAGRTHCMCNVYDHIHPRVTRSEDNSNDITSIYSEVSTSRVDSKCATK